MEKFLLHRVFVDDELYIVYQQVVRAAVFVVEFVSRALRKRLYKFVREILGGGVDEVHLGVVLLYLRLYRFHKVRLAEAGVAVDQQGVIRLAGIRRDSLSRRMGELV